MTDADLLEVAVAELYGHDPGEFTERRSRLAASARAAGHRLTARQISALRKPTRSAWLVNQLIRADPDVAPRLARLGDELRAAEASLDGRRIRELSAARRQLTEDLVRQALRLAGQQAAPTGLREELTATFSAALADPAVASELAAGTLLRPVHRADFNPGGPGLILLPSPAEGPAGARRPAAARKRTTARPTAAPPRPAPSRIPGTTRAKGAAEANSAGEARAARAKAGAAAPAEAAWARRQALAEARQALTDAGRAAAAAARAEQDHRDEVNRLEERLDQIRGRLSEAQAHLAEARARTRQAETEQRRAQHVVDRLTGR